MSRLSSSLSLHPSSLPVTVAGLGLLVALLWLAETSWLFPAVLAAGAGLLAGTRMRRRDAAPESLPVPVSKAAPSASPIPWNTLERLPDPVILIDERRVVVAANQLARELFSADMVGRDLGRTLRHPAALETVRKVFSGLSRSTAELVLPVPLSRVFTLHVFDLSREDTAPGVRAMLVLHEMTAAHRAQQMRVDFVANASHELRSPLAALIGFIETLKGPARDDPKARERFLDIMQREAGRMARLVDDLLSLGRVESHEHVRPDRPVDLGALLADVTELMAVQAGEKDMTIRLELLPDLAPVAGDPDELTQVFHNLIDNAIKYGRPGSEVVVSVSPASRIPESGGAGLAVAVQDRGEGIPALHLPRLTERFYRIDKARSRDMGGTGLGLAIVKHIVSRHRGRLAVASTEGDGSTFTVYLPIASSVS